MYGHILSRKDLCEPGDTELWHQRGFRELVHTPVHVTGNRQYRVALNPPNPLLLYVYLYCCASSPSLRSGCFDWDWCILYFIKNFTCSISIIAMYSYIHGVTLCAITQNV